MLLGMPQFVKLLLVVSSMPLIRAAPGMPITIDTPDIDRPPIKDTIRTLPTHDFQELSSLPFNTQPPPQLHTRLPNQFELRFDGLWQTYNPKAREFAITGRYSGRGGPVYRYKDAPKRMLMEGRWANADVSSVDESMRDRGMIYGTMRCQDSGTLPSIQDIAKDSTIAQIQISEQLKFSFANTFLSKAIDALPVMSYRLVPQTSFACMFIDNPKAFGPQKPISKGLHDLPVSFLQLMRDIKMMHWYQFTGQVLSHGPFDPSRGNPKLDARFSTGRSSPIFSTTTLTFREIRQTGWTAIVNSANQIRQAYKAWLLAGQSSPMDTEQVLLHARLIDHLCGLIAKAENIVSFHGMVERIAELAKYPAKFIESATTLDIRLDRLKLLAGWPNLEKAVELHRQVSESRAKVCARILEPKDIPLELHHEIGKCLASHSDSQVHDLFFKLLLIDHPVIPADLRAAQQLLNDPTVADAFAMRGRVWN